MSYEKDPSEQSDRPESEPSPLDTGEDVSALISGLITQNAELIRKLQQLDSQNTPGENAVPDAHDAVEEPEAKAEAVKPVTEAIQQGHLIIQKAEEKAESIIEEARGQAKTILTQAAQKAEQKASNIITGAKKGPLEEVGLNPQKNTGVDSAALYDGVVELLFPPPIVVGNVLKLKRHLKAKVRTRMVGVAVSRCDGVCLKLRLPQPTPLVKVIKALPEVREVSAERWITAKSLTPGKTADNLPTGRLTVKMNPQ
jgi:dsDNA-specific endonuclease/ATPase MutS2